MTDRSAPNPKCAYCGLSTKTSKQLGGFSYETKCVSIFCRLLHGEDRITGEGTTQRDARNDYRKKKSEIKGVESC